MTRRCLFCPIPILPLLLLHTRPLARAELDQHEMARPSKQRIHTEAEEQPEEQLPTDVSRPELKVEDEDSAAKLTPNKQNAGLCQLLTAPVPMALAVIGIVTAQSLEIASRVMTWD